MKIKNILFLGFLFVGISFASYGQKYGYIDSDYILSKMPEYQSAKDELNKYSEKWQKDIEHRYEVIHQKEKEFLKVEAILPTAERERRKKAIEELRSEALEMKKTRFGINGDLFQKRKELIEPIQDKVFEALKKVASNRHFSFIFDKANQSNLIFADPKFDVSDMVIRELGIKTR